MKIAVTGAGGKIGYQVAKVAAEAGHEVIMVDVRMPGTGPRQRQEEALPGRFVYADLTRREFVQPILEQVEAVCHLGEIPGEHMGRAADDVYQTNVTIGSNILQTAADLRLRHVAYASSCQVYGTWGGQRWWPPYDAFPPAYLPVDEAHPLRPQSGYATSKVANETYARMTADKHGLPVSAFRMPFVITDDHAERWARHLRRDRGTEEPGRRRRAGSNAEMGTYVHVADAAVAFLRAIEANLDGFEAYNLAAEDVALNQPLREMLAEQLPQYPPLPTDWPDFASPIDSRKARTTLNWETPFSLRRLADSLGNDLASDRG